MHSRSFFLFIGIVSHFAAGCGGVRDVSLGGADDSGPADSILGDTGGPPPATYPRLLVATQTGVQIWNNADRITADRPADVTINGGGPAGVAELALAGDRLFVANISPSDLAVDPILIFDGASTLAAGALPTDTLPPAAFGSTTLRNWVQVDALGQLWTNESSGPCMVGDALSLNHDSVAKAHFYATYGQIGGFVYDAVGDKLLGGQVSGAGVLVWNTPRTKSGSSIGSDWTLAPVALWGESISNGRYWAVDYGTHAYAWNDVASVSAPRAPDVTLDFPSAPPVPQTSSVRTRDADDVLLVTLERPGEVDIWKNASTVTSGTPPSFKISDASISTTYVRGAILAKNNRLYVRDESGVAIFDDALGTPRFVTRLTNVQATVLVTERNFLLLE